MTPLSVLVVDDDPVKHARVAEVVRANAGDGVTLAQAGHLSAARELLREVRYDLLVLDIALPPLKNRPPTPDGGLQLLEELEDSTRLNMPTHVVGLTAHQDVYEAVAARFASRAVSLVYYDPTSLDWAEALGARVTFCARAKVEATARPAYGVDLAIVCALPEPELSAVRANGWAWHVDRRPGDETMYYRAVFTAVGGVERQAVAAAACQMGMTATAVLAMKIILQYRPRYIAMAGISAGRSGEVALGDVLVANPTWDWGAGKVLGDETGAARHLLAPAQLPLRPRVRERLTVLASDQEALDRIRREWGPGAPATALRVRIGPVASGSAVVEDSATMASIHEQHRRLLGVEMEGYAVHVAAEEAPEPRPTAFVAKAVVDFGVPGKADAVHAYAAYASARVIRLYAERYL